MSCERSEKINRREAMRILAAFPAASVAKPVSAEREMDGKNPDRPNILLVHCHDLGQFLGCYGIPTVRTPNLDNLARQGVLFEKSFCTAPQCSPSRASIFTGRYPHCTGVMGLTHANFAWDLYPDEKHLGQFLKEAGYQTIAVGVIHETRSGAARCGMDRHVRKPFASSAVDAAIGVLESVKDSGDQPFYLQVGIIEPHRLPSKGKTLDHGFLGDHIQPDDSKGVTVPGYLRDTSGTRTELAELQGAVKHVDTQIGRLLEALRKLGFEQNTLVIFTTDHGVGLPRAKCSLYDPGLQTALILRFPARDGWHGGRRLKPLISNIDYVPSILDLLEIPVPDNIQGRSFVPLLDGKAYSERNELFGEITYHDYYDPRRCIRTHDHKLILNFSTSYFFMDPSQSWRPRSDTVVPPNPALAYHEPAELYDLRKDPWELKNVINETEYETVRDHLTERLKKHMMETQDPILQGAVTSPMHEKIFRILDGDWSRGWNPPSRKKTNG